MNIVRLHEYIDYEGKKRSYPFYEIVNGLTAKETEDALFGLNIKHKGKHPHQADWFVVNQDISEDKQSKGYVAYCCYSHGEDFAPDKWECDEHLTRADIAKLIGCKQ